MELNETDSNDNVLQAHSEDRSCRLGDTEEDIV